MGDDGLTRPFPPPGPPVPLVIHWSDDASATYDLVPIPPTLADAIRRARTGAGLSQVQLAAQVGVNPRTLRNWERGATEPAFTAVSRIAKATGRSLWYFDHH